MSLVVVVFLVVELILYVELNVETWSLLDCMWKHCSSCRMDGFCVETLYSKKTEVSLLGSSLLLFFGNNSVCRIIVLVWMTGCMQETAGFNHMFSLLKRCKYSLYSDTMLNYCIGLTKPCVGLDMLYWFRMKQTQMYICTLEEFILVDIWKHCCTSRN